MFVFANEQVKRCLFCQSVPVPHCVNESAAHVRSIFDDVVLFLFTIVMKFFPRVSFRVCMKLLGDCNHLFSELDQIDSLDLLVDLSLNVHGQELFFACNFALEMNVGT